MQREKETHVESSTGTGWDSQGRLFWGRGFGAGMKIWKGTKQRWGEYENWDYCQSMVSIIKTACKPGFCIHTHIWMEIYSIVCAFYRDSHEELKEQWTCDIRFMPHALLYVSHYSLTLLTAVWHGSSCCHHLADEETKVQVRLSNLLQIV